ncbi:hypothetical protein KUTeg_013440 [Tegillarca granosa]|uniref:N-acetyltransferase domain-containing protein n=1 Tax=Tegillarca granosa TaxID=220873 RepID=A0ABQ9EW46_TEGGR|nr:hypothetical protein KUTeg_013440 [Tegillarca granosa]
MSKMKICVLHKNRQYLDKCVEVLNEEWSRSKAARLHSLEKSNDKFPLNLVLVQDNDSTDAVVGHSRLSIVHGTPDSCLLESVVVPKAARGKGYGRIIVEKTEEFAKGQGFKTMYLSTHDKQDFYKHLGYEFCPPIVSFGVSPDLLPEHLIKQLSKVNKKKISQDKKESDIIEVVKNSNQNDNSCQTPISAVSPPPLPPPPPPPPSIQSVSEKKPQIVRWDPSAISWMKKCLVT